MATATLTSVTNTLPSFVNNGGRTAGVVDGVLVSAGYASGAGISPAATGADNVIAAYTLPGGTLNYVSGACTAGGPTLRIKVRGHTAANGNNKAIKVIWNATTAAVGSTVSGGTTIAATGTITINAKSFVIDAWVKKTGAPNSNTQVAGADLILSDATPVSAGVPVYATATEANDILIAITGNAGTTATDIVIDSWEIVAYA